MKKFIGTKIIKADPEPITWADHYKKQGWEWPPGKTDAYRVGYTVGYPDSAGDFDGPLAGGCDYISWSPSDVFEASYHEIEGLSFGQAIEALKIGEKVARPGWNGGGMHLEAQHPDKNSKMTHPYLFMTIPGCKEGTRLLPWQPAQVDIFATDWLIVE